MNVSRTTSILIACMALGLAGCKSSSGPAADVASQGQVVVTADPIEPVVIREIPLPPGVAPEELAPRVGTALVKAMLPLDKVMQDISRPAWALGSGTQPVTPQPDSEPVLQAQKAYLKAKIDIREARYFEAINKLTEANRLAPGNPDVLRSLGEANLLSGKLVLAASFYQQAVERVPDDIDSLFMLGNISVEQGHWVSAVWAYHKLLALPPRPGSNDPAMATVSAYHLAGALEKLDYDAAAVESLDKLLTPGADVGRPGRVNRQIRALNTRRDSIMISVGDAYCRLGKPDQAIAFYKDALNQSDSQTDPSIIYTRLIYAQLRASQFKAAQNSVMNLLSIGRFDEPTIAIVDYYAQNGGDLGQLQSNLRSVYNAKGQTPELAIALSRLMPAKDKTDFLVAHLEKHPNSPAVFDELARYVDTLPGKLASDPALAKSLVLAGSRLIQARPELSPGVVGRLRVLDPQAVSVLAAISSLSQPPGKPEPGLSFIKASILADQGKTAEAIGEYRKALDQAPDLLAARLALARLLLSTGEVDAAEGVLFLVKDKDQPGITSLMINILLAQKKPAQALALVNRQLERQPGNVELTIQKAELQFMAGDAIAAERTLYDGIDQKPTTEVFYEKLFDLYDTGKINDSRQQYPRLMRRLVGTIPQSRLARLQRARFMAAGGQNQEAIELVQQLLRENPKDGQALGVLLEVTAATGRVDEANRLASQALAQFPMERDVLRSIRDYYQRTRQMEPLFDVYEKLLLLEPASPARAIELSEVLIARKDFVKAVRVVEQAMPQAKEPNLSALNVALGRALLLNDKPALAQKPLADVLIAGQYTNVRLVTMMYAAALVGDPGMTVEQKVAATNALVQKAPGAAPEIADQVAHLFEIKGERAISNQLRVDALANNPHHPALNNNLAYNWTLQGLNLDKALEMSDVALQSDPDVSAYLDTKGWILYKLGRFKEAVDYLKRARETGNADSSVVVDHLGDALWRVGQKQQAIQTWKQAQAVRTTEKQQNQQLLNSPTPVVPRWVFDHSADIELKDIDARLQAKIKAAQSNTEPPVAPVVEQAVAPAAVPAAVNDKK